MEPKIHEAQKQNATVKKYLCYLHWRCS